MAQTVITPQAVLSYPHLHAPQEPMKGNTGKAKYSATLVFPAGTDLAALEAAAVEAAATKFGAELKLPNGTKLSVKEALARGILRSPFRRDGDMKGYPEGSVFINCRTEQQPQVVYAYPDAATGKPAVMPKEKIRDEMYPGALVRASIVAFGYENSGNKGVSFALNNLQKLGEGERIDGRKAADAEFDADLNAAPADLAGLV